MKTNKLILAGILSLLGGVAFAQTSTPTAPASSVSPVDQVKKDNAQIAKDNKEIRKENIDVKHDNAGIKKDKK